MSLKNIEDLKYKIKIGSVLGAKRIYKNVNVDYLTAKHIGFTSKDKKYNTSHSVIYFSERDFTKSWSCDCKWFSLKNLFCKHILAVFMRLNKDKKFLKKFKKKKL